MEFLLWDICESKRLTSGDLRFQNECKWKYKFVGFGYCLVSVNQFSREWFFVEVIPGMMSRRYVNIHTAGTFQKCSDWNRDDIGWLARASGISIQCNASMKMLVSEAAYQEWLVFLFFQLYFCFPETGMVGSVWIKEQCWSCIASWIIYPLSLNISLSGPLSSAYFL